MPACCVRLRASPAPPRALETMGAGWAFREVGRHDFVLSPRPPASIADPPALCCIIVPDCTHNSLLIWTITTLSCPFFVPNRR